MNNQIPPGIGKVIDLDRFPNINPTETILLLCDDLHRNMDYFVFRGEYDEWWRLIDKHVKKLSNQEKELLMVEVSKKKYEYKSILADLSRRLKCS